MSEQEKVTQISFTDGEIAALEYILEQHVNKLQEAAANEHSGIARFMIDSGIITTKGILDKIKPEEVEAVVDDHGFESGI
jgi:hypothetical protein